jgi:hypothetical protein
MGYEAPFSGEDLSAILARMNQDPASDLSKFISKPRAELIVSHRPYEAVEQLLDLRGFSLKEPIL